MNKIWDSIPESEIYRLAKVLQSHLRKLNIKKSKSEREIFTKLLLESQEYICAFGNGTDIYCWNHPKNKDLDYLKLEWGHKVPQSVEKIENAGNLYLLCARCNNHIQSSKKLEDIVSELENKLSAVKKILVK